MASDRPIKLDVTSKEWRKVKIIFFQPRSVVMMTSLSVASYLTCLILGYVVQGSHLEPQASVHQDKGFILADVGKNVTLRCFYEGDVSAWVLWYKQTLGQKPKLISTFYVYDTKITFYDEFKNNRRFTLDAANNGNHLTISDLQISDSATYYCASSYTFVLTFAEGTTVKVNEAGLKTPALVRQSASETMQPGGSVTLNCTVHTGTCDGEHSVYWFKETEPSHPGLIYTHGGRNDQCGRKTNPQTDTCVYNLPTEDQKPSHVGTYYCAVASCGHIVFGNGTMLNIQDDVDSFALREAIAFTTILCILLVPCLCVIININSCICPESHARLSDFFIKDGEDCQHVLRESKNRTDDTWSKCVYF